MTDRRSARQVSLGRVADQAERSRLWAELGLGVLYPALYAILGLSSQELYKYNPLLCISIWVPVVVTNFIVWMRAKPSQKSFLELLRDSDVQHTALKDADDRLAFLQKSMEIIAHQATFSLSNWQSINEYATRTYSTREDLRFAIDQIASFLHLDCGEIFGIGASERWNFAIYIYHSGEDILYPLWRQKAPTHPSIGMGRSWGRGEGHVGRCFVDRRSIITRDAMHADALPLSAIADNLKLAYDHEVYRSFATYPILATADRALGVVVATSDCEGRYDIENTPILAHVAGVIGALMELAHIDFDKLADADSADEAPIEG